MKITTIDNQKYIKIGDLWHLLKTEREDILDEYEDPAGAKDPEDEARLDLINKIFEDVIESDLDLCETDEDIKKLYTRIRYEFYKDKYILTELAEGEDGKKHLYYFRKFCRGAARAIMKLEGKSDEEIEEEMETCVGEPVFSELSSDSYFFDSHEEAYSAAKFINETYSRNVKIRDAFLASPRALERMHEAIFGKVEEEE